MFAEAGVTVRGDILVRGAGKGEGGQSEPPEMWSQGEYSANADIGKASMLFWDLREALQLTCAGPTARSQSSGKWLDWELGLPW